MRKALILAAAALLVVAFAVPSFPAETTFSGSYRVRSVMEYNMESASAGNLLNAGVSTGHDELYTGYFDQRFRLTITHTRNEYLKAVVTLDLAEDLWGQGRALRISGDATGELVFEAYIQALTPIGLFTFGAKDGAFGYGTWSDSGGDSCNLTASWVVKFGNVVAAVAYTKYRDMVADWLGALTYTGGPPVGFSLTGGPLSVHYNKDLNSFVISAYYLTENYKFGALFQYITDPNSVTAAALLKHTIGFFNFTGETAHGFPDPLGGGNLFGPYAAGPAPYWAWPSPFGLVTGGAIGMGRMGMYDADAFAACFFTNMKFMDGMLEFKAEVDYIWGKAIRNRYGDRYNTNYAIPFAGVGLPRVLDVGALNIYADLTFNYDIFSVGVAFLYGSGIGEWNGIDQDRFSLNNTGLGDFHWGNVIVPGDMGLYGGTTWDAFLASPLGLGATQENVMSVKLHWSVCPMENLDIHGAFIWARYVHSVGRYAVTAAGAPAAHWDRYYGHPMNYMWGLAGNMYVPAGVSSDLGWEIDLGVTWTIMEGLTLNSEFGVLFTGDAFDYRRFGYFGGPSVDWGEIYTWVNTLTYEF
jgi:hypothetical protein